MQTFARVSSTGTDFGAGRFAAHLFIPFLRFVTAMTVVTGISLYGDPGVIFVIAVTAQKFDESAFSRSLGAILDAQRLQHLIGELADEIRNGCPPVDAIFS